MRPLLIPLVRHHETILTPIGRIKIRDLTPVHGITEEIHHRGSIPRDIPVDVEVNFGNLNPELPKGIQELEGTGVVIGTVGIVVFPPENPIPRGLKDLQEILKLILLDPIVLGVGGKTLPHGPEEIQVLGTVPRELPSEEGNDELAETHENTGLGGIHVRTYDGRWWDLTKSGNRGQIQLCVLMEKHTGIALPIDSGVLVGKNLGVDDSVPFGMNEGVIPRIDRAVTPCHHRGIPRCPHNRIPISTDDVTRASKMFAAVKNLRSRIAHGSTYEPKAGVLLPCDDTLKTGGREYDDVIGGCYRVSLFRSLTLTPRTCGHQ